MTIYFEEVRRRVLSINHEHTEPEPWLGALARIEAQVIRDVRLVAADREVPFAVRRDIAAHIATHAVDGIGRTVQQQHALASRTSSLAEALHVTFRALGKMRCMTRFGILSDCPVDIASRIRVHDRQHPNGHGPTGLIGETLERATAELAELRVQLKDHDDASSHHYDEDHARKLRAEVQQLEALVASLTTAGPTSAP